MRFHTNNFYIFRRGKVGHNTKNLKKISGSIHPFYDYVTFVFFYDYRFYQFFINQSNIVIITVVRLT